jgi:hypothetical protein
MDTSLDVESSRARAALLLKEFTTNFFERSIECIHGMEGRMHQNPSPCSAAPGTGILLKGHPEEISLAHATPCAAALQGRVGGTCQQDGAHGLGAAGPWRHLSGA